MDNNGRRVEGRFGEMVDSLRKGDQRPVLERKFRVILRVMGEDCMTRGNLGTLLDLENWLISEQRFVGRRN